MENESKPRTEHKKSGTLVITVSRGDAVEITGPAVIKSLDKSIHIAIKAPLGTKIKRIYDYDPTR